jgi:processive 1,2-diacylglycerol beta-glucosyltransferase
VNGSSLRIALLTSSLGEGHVAAARALAAALREAGDPIEIETIDFWSLMNPVVAKMVRQAYLDTIAEEPELYDAAYRLEQRTWRSLFDASRSVPSPLEIFIDHFNARVARAYDEALDTELGEPYRSDRLIMRQLSASLSGRRRNATAFRTVVRPALVRWVWMRLSRRLEKLVFAFRPHAAIATQMNPAALLAAMKMRRALRLPLFAVPTDFGIHDAWLQPGVDVLCVAHETVTQSPLPRGSVIHATGMPLMPAFRHPPERGEARAELGLHAERPLVLVGGGGLGLGVARLSERILAEVPEVVVAAVSGRNAAARAALQALAPRHAERLIDCGWTERMPAWLRAADVVVGKPGGLTVAETLACGRYLLAIHSPGGQEGFNARFLVEHGAGELVQEAELGARLRVLFAAPAERRMLEAQAAATGRRDGAARIAELVLDTARGARSSTRDRVPA